MDTHHQTGGESWGVRRGGRHGKGDCQLRRNTDQISNGCYTDVGSKSEVRIKISSGSSGKQGGVGSRAAKKQLDGATHGDGESGH